MRIFPVEWRGAGRLAVVSRPAADQLAVEFAELKAAGFDTLVSLLAGSEAAELGLSGEGEIAETAGLHFRSLPVFDYAVPESPSFREGLFELHDRLREGAAIAAHCRASVGRAPLLVASLLILDGADPDDAWDRVSRARGVSVPDTDAQRQWVRALSART